MSTNSPTDPSYETTLKHQFLFSMPQLQSDFFGSSLIYLCEHSAEGAMGLVVNKPSAMKLDEVFEQLELKSDLGLNQTPVFIGGPVSEDRGFLLHCRTERTWQSSLSLSDGLQLTTSMDVLQAIADGEGPFEFLLALGYAGWDAGQLEDELSRNLWLSCPANLDILFRTPPAERLASAAAQLGIDINLLSDQAGHA